MLKKSLANTLCDPAMDLALEQERVDSAAEIVDDGIALDYDDAGIGIDLDLDDVATVGKGLGWRHSVTRCIEPRLHARRPFRGIVRRLRHRKNIEAEISARYAEYPIGKTYVLRRDFQKVRSELSAFADDGVSRLIERHARDSKRIEKLDPGLDAIIDRSQAIQELASGFGGERGPAEGPGLVEGRRLEPACQCWGE